MSAPTPVAQTRAWLSILRDILAVVLLVVGVAGVTFTLYAWNATAFWIFVFTATGVVGYKLAGR